MQEIYKIESNENYEAVDHFNSKKRAFNLVEIYFEIRERGCIKVYSENFTKKK